MRAWPLVDAMQAAALLGEQRLGQKGGRHVGHDPELLARRGVGCSKLARYARRREDATPFFASDTERGERGVAGCAPMGLERLNVRLELPRFDTT